MFASSRNVCHAGKCLFSFISILVFSSTATVAQSNQFGPTTSFQNIYTFNSPTGPSLRVLATDFNHDGYQDLYAPGYNVTGSPVFVGDGTGVNYDIGNYICVDSCGGFATYQGDRAAYITGDFNKDGAPDILFYGADGSGGQTFVLETYNPPPYDPATNPNEYRFFFYCDSNTPCVGFNELQPYPTDVALGDFNNDGNLDAAFAVPENNYVAVLYGTGQGTFASVQTFPVGTFPHSIASGDFNGDGKTDLVTVNSGSNDVSILIGNGAGGFSMATNYPVGPSPIWLTAGDFNNDGKTDIAAINGDNTISVLIRSGSSFQSSTLTSNNQQSGIESADMNGDNKLDLIVSNHETNSISIFRGDGAGHFSSPSSIPVGLNPWSVTVADLNNDGKNDIVLPNNFLNPGCCSDFGILLNNTLFESATTSPGSNVAVQTADATLTFDNVVSGGTTSVTPIDAATAGDVPGGFAILESAFEVSTTATFSGNVTTCFTVSSVNDPTDFANLRVLHNENGSLVDRTSSHDFSGRQICATTTSFSPFFITSTGKKIKSLFDQSKAFKSGSTIPVKVQILNQSDQNISSGTLALTARGLRRIGSSTTSDVTDAGNSNPDFTFRYDSSLQGYIYNLKTTGLASGKYVLSIYAGSDRTFLYTVQFDVK